MISDITIGFIIGVVITWVFVYLYGHYKTVRWRNNITIGTKVRTIRNGKWYVGTVEAKILSDVETWRVAIELSYGTVIYDNLKTNQLWNPIT